MSELYTSLTRLKMAMNGGQLPPMTPLTEDAKKYIDPALTIGMGALIEDEKKGLRCPVRGCGQYHHHLSIHATQMHKTMGGARGLREALSMPRSIPLMSARARAEWRRTHPTTHIRPSPGAATPKGYDQRKASASVSQSRMSVNARNLKDRCDGQLTAKIVDLDRSLGREATGGDMERVHGEAIVHYIRRVYGSWQQFRTMAGLRASPKRGRFSGTPRQKNYCSKCGNELPRGGRRVRRCRTCWRAELGLAPNAHVMGSCP